VRQQNTRTERVAGRKELLKIGTILLPERKRLEVRAGLLDKVRLEKRKGCGSRSYRKNGRSAASTPDQVRLPRRQPERSRVGADAGRGAVDESALG
jgi:hypothetical protein